MLRVLRRGFGGYDKGIELQGDPRSRPGFEVATGLEALGGSLGLQPEFLRRGLARLGRTWLGYDQEKEVVVGQDRFEVAT